MHKRTIIILCILSRIFYGYGDQVQNSLIQDKILTEHPVLKPACAYQLKNTIICDHCTLEQWAQKIATLKERPVEFSSLPSSIAYQKYILSSQEFFTTLKECTRVIGQLCAVDNEWLEQKSLYKRYPQLFNINRTLTYPINSTDNFLFKPYVQKLLLPVGSAIACFGDLHGSIHSFMRDILKLRADGYIDNNFNIRKSHFYMIFMGDYIDRGIYGLEVMYTLMRLKIANPQKVFFVRGNHEDYLLAPSFKRRFTKPEPKDNAQSFLDELFFKFGLSEKQIAPIYRFYDILPVGLYLGSNYGQHIDFVQCCHGGIEFGYDPYVFLHSDSHIKFELIEKLWRKKHFLNRFTTPVQRAIKAELALDVLCNDIQDFVPQAGFYEVPGSKYTRYFGFMWSDFFLDKSKVVGQRSAEHGGWVFGAQMTNDILNWVNSDRVTLQAIFRAHQHNNETGGPLLNRLCCEKGLVDVWHDQKVYTFLSAPSSKLEVTGQHCFTYDAFVLVITAPRYKDWKFIKYLQDTSVEQKVWRRILINRHPPKIETMKQPIIDNKQIVKLLQRDFS